MSSPFDDSPEDLVRLRTTVYDWVEKSQEALETFRLPDESFLRDSKAGNQGKNEEDDHLSLTITARSYMALANIDRCLNKIGDSEPPGWIEKFTKFLEKYVERIEFGEKGLEEIFFINKDKPKYQTNFDCAHIADLVFVISYIQKFYPDTLGKIKSTRYKALQKLGGNVSKTLKQTFVKIRYPRHTGRVAPKASTARATTFLFDSEEGEVFLENNEPDSRHFFVTLHGLRALAILGREPKLDRNRVNKLSEFVRKFCAEQCFYAQRTNRHQKDVFRLTFAGVIYCLYGKNIDKDLCVAFIEALAAAQQENGSWPATHPILRGENKRPWHITSHEIALCLTWLYFQPCIPDSARLLLLGMMEKYFTKWVIPTFIRVHKKNGEGEFKGWFDDHTITHDFAVGWATAIVCHFLANYHSVLNDHINRRVIEPLGLQASSSKYLIDETEHERSPRWRKPVSTKQSAAADGPWLATWPDLPPFAWSWKCPKGDLARRLSWSWTDPQPKNRISWELVGKVLLPVFKNPNARPQKDRCSGLLPGEPGTRKTSLVKAVASILEWPVVIVPASVIFARGFDLMEERSNEVFRRLNYLTGCIIFFDEFEEFFRDRDDSDSSIHDRTIAAFTTSAMLPRLQDLHDANRCLIFLATNDEQKIDPAIKRPGRIDFRIPIDHPNCERILEYLKAPTRQTLKNLDLCVDESLCRVDKDDEKRFKAISEAVKKAVSKLFDPEEEVRFAFVEEALKAAARPDVISQKRKRERAAMISLRSSRKHTQNSDGGPRDLWDQ